MGNYTAHLTIAEGYMELDMFDEAALALEEIPPEFKTQVDVLAMRGRIYEAAGNWIGCEVVYGNLVKQQPQCEEWWIAWALATREVKSLQSAIDILRKATEQQPDSTSIMFNLARFLGENGDFAEAKLLLRKLFKLDPDYRLLALDLPELSGFWSEIGG